MPHLHAKDTQSHLLAEKIKLNHKYIQCYLDKKLGQISRDKLPKSKFSSFSKSFCEAELVGLTWVVFCPWSSALKGSQADGLEGFRPSGYFGHTDGNSYQIEKLFVTVSKVYLNGDVHCKYMISLRTSKGFQEEEKNDVENLRWWRWQELLTGLIADNRSGSSQWGKEPLPRYTKHCGCI